MAITGRLRSFGRIKLAEPPPPKGWSSKDWDRHLNRGPKKTKTSTGDVDDLEGGDPIRLMPRLRQIHKMAEQELEDADAIHQSPGRVVPVGKEKESQGFEYAQLGPNAGETGWDAPVTWKPKKLPYRTKVGYKLQGHTEVGGLRIAIENRKGSVRKGKDRDGHEWRTKMKNPYGYIVGTEGKDGEAVDAYVGPDKEAPKAFVVHQHKPDGTGYDEDKVMLGFRSKKEAKEAYLKHYDSEKFLGPISIVSMDRLRELVKSKRKLVKISHVDERVAEIVRLSRCAR
jgi:hypothetical protein